MSDRTIGMLMADGRRVCDTLELAIGKGAIPCVHYKVRVTYSPRFKTMLPLVADVQPLYKWCAWIVVALVAGIIVRVAVRLYYVKKICKITKN